MCYSGKRHNKTAQAVPDGDSKYRFSDPMTQNEKRAAFKAALKVMKTKKNHGKSRGFYGCGGRTRTYDLRVMSPTSFQLLYSAISQVHS